MSQATRWTIATLFILAMFVELVTQQESWELTRTSHGIIPEGYGVAYEMLMQLGLAAGRSYENERSLAEAATVWWIEPNNLCSGVGDAPLEAGRSGVWKATEWMARGGTGVVFLPDQPLDCLAEGMFAGARVPARALDVDQQESIDEDVVGEHLGGEQVIDERIANEDAHEDANEHEIPGITTLMGEILRHPRILSEMPLHHFRNSENYEVLVASEEFGPFVLSRQIGAGRLILVASARPLRNASLREADAAPFIVDLALAFGAPLIDEREHGILPRPSPIPFLVQSAAMPAIGGVMILGALLIWRARAESPPRLEPNQPTPPTLDAYIGSVAHLYRATRDHAAVLRAYQEFALSQLRRSLRLPPDATPRQLEDRLRSSRRLTPEELAKLFDQSACFKRSELLRATAEIDRILEVATR